MDSGESKKIKESKQTQMSYLQCHQQFRSTPQAVIILSALIAEHDTREELHPSTVYRHE